MEHLFVKCTAAARQHPGRSHTDSCETLPGAKTFDANVAAWKTSSVVSMKGMFWRASGFNQPIGGWNTAAVTDMSCMFRLASAFSQPIGGWVTAAVAAMGSMFEGATAFDQPTRGWNTAAVTDVSYITDARGVAIEVPASMAVANQVQVNQRLLELLRAFDAVAKAHNLTYWATKGTLLGAIRHRGHIPWDEDVDLCMPKGQWEAMRRHAHVEFPPRLWVQDYLSDPLFRHKRQRQGFDPMAKVRDLDTDWPWYSAKNKETLNALQIDVYFETPTGDWPDFCGPMSGVYPLKDVPYESITISVPVRVKRAVK